MSSKELFIKIWQRISHTKECSIIFKEGAFFAQGVHTDIPDWSNKKPNHVRIKDTQQKKALRA